MSVLVNTFSKHAKDVTSCSFSPNSKIFASSSGDKTVRLWNVADGTELSMSPLLGHSYGVNSCHFSPFGTLLATASTDGNVHLWDVNTGSVIAVLQGHKSGVRVCRFSPNSRFLVSGSTDETFCIWDVSSKKLVKCTEKLESSVMTCCFTPDSMHIVAGTSFGDLSVWEVQSGKMMKFLAEGHDLGVTDCCFSPNFGSASMFIYIVIYVIFAVDTVMEGLLLVLLIRHKACNYRERRKRGALLHGVPYGVPKWSTLKILFRMSTVDQCVSSI